MADSLGGTRAWQVTWLPEGIRFTVGSGQSLVEAALAAGLSPARSCRNGTCRTCIARLQSGQVRYRVAWPGLSVDEHDEGLILPCVAEAQSDLVVRAGSGPG